MNIWLQRIGKPDQEPWVLARAQELPGRLLLTFCFAVLAWSDLQQSWLTPDGVPWRIIICPLLCAFAGVYRRLMLALTTWWFLVYDPGWFSTVWLKDLIAREHLVGVHFDTDYRLMAIAVFVFCAVLIGLQREFPRSLPSRWPVASILSIYFALVWAGDIPGWAPYPRFLLYCFLNAFGSYIWFLAYALRDNHPQTRSPLWFEMATFHTFYCGRGLLPIGLGAANLSKLESKDARELAVCQIKSLKLLLDCAICSLAFCFLEQLARDVWKLPLIGAVLNDEPGQHYSRLICWGTLLVAFFQICLKAAIAGNLLVACARFAGFRLLQQTYKPFQSRSLADFWNRVSFYFKQPMVDLFFYPTFLGWFRKRPKIRMAFAMFMAIVVGNVLFHFPLFLSVSAEIGLARTLAGTKTYLLYCVFLWAGIYVSGTPVAGSYGARILALAKIAIFFSLLRVFDDYYGDATPLQAYFHFVAYLVGFPA